MKNLLIMLAFIAGTASPLFSQDNGSVFFSFQPYFNLGAQVPFGGSDDNKPHAFGATGMNFIVRHDDNPLEFTLGGFYGAERAYSKREEIVGFNFAIGGRFATSKPTRWNKVYYVNNVMFTGSQSVAHENLKSAAISTNHGLQVFMRPGFVFFANLEVGVDLSSDEMLYDGAELVRPYEVRNALFGRAFFGVGYVFSTVPEWKRKKKK